MHVCQSRTHFCRAPVGTTVTCVSRCHGREFSDSGVKLNTLATKLAVTYAIRSFFGEVGAAMRVDLLAHDEEKQESVLRVSERCVFIERYVAIENESCAALGPHIVCPRNSLPSCSTP